METFALYFIIILALVWLVLNIIATYIAATGFYIIKERKYWQILFAWLLPYVGASLVIYFNREHWFEQRRKKKHGNDTSISNSTAISHAIGSAIDSAD